MKLLISYLRPQWRLVLLALLLAAVNQVFSLLDPLIFRHVIDEYATRFDQYTTGRFLRGVTLLLLAAVGVAFVSRVAKNFQDYFVNVVTQRLGARLYSDGIRHSLELPYQLFEDQRSGETLGKLQKVRADVEKLVTAAINVVFQTLVGVVFVVVYAFSVHWLIAPVYFGTVPLLGWLSSVLSRRIKTVQKTIVAETAALAGSTTESLRNIELVKSMGLGAQEVARLNATTDRILALELRKVRYLRSLSFVQGTAVNALRTSILFMMLYLIFARQISVGQFFALWIYSFFIFGPLQELGSVINVYRETEASLANFQAILDAPREPRPVDPVEIGELTRLAFDNVSFSHQSVATPAVQEVSFEVQRGETVAFVGPSGAGKTTLVKLLVGLYRPAAGRILYDGQPHDRVELERLREQIGFVTQDTQLFSGSIRDNLLFVRPDATDAECLDVLQRAACDGLLARADRGLDTLIGEGGVKVSGGEKQRLSIARALLRRPHLMVFDEATSSLDSLTEEEVSRTIREVAADRWVMTVLIAHRLSTGERRLEAVPA
jgi:ATP-binding cassette subfamily B protein